MNTQLYKGLAKESIIIIVIAMVTILLLPLLGAVNVIVDMNSTAEIFFICICLLTA